MKFILIIFLIVFAQFLLSSSKILQKPIEGDFEVFYLSGKAAIQGENPYLIYGQNGSFIRNPPPSLLFFSFISLFPPQLSQLVFFTSSLLSVGLGLILLLKLCLKHLSIAVTRKMPFSLWYLSLFFSIFVIIFFPFRYALTSGHINGYLFLILSAAIYCYFQRKYLLTGILVSAGGSLVITPLFLGIIFLLKKNIKAAVGIIVGIISLNLSAVMLFGLKVYPWYLQATGSYFDFNVNTYYNQSLAAALSRLSLNSQINFLILLISIIVFVIFVCVLPKKAVSNNYTDFILWNLCILFTLVFVTSSWQYYFIIAIIPLVTTLFLLYKLHPPAKYYLSFIVSFILMAVNIKNPAAFINLGVWGKLILSHVLWGAIILMMLNFYLGRRFSFSSGKTAGE